MKIKFSPYRRRDGELMLYINNDRGVSVGISPEKGWSPYGKGITQGMRNVMESVPQVFRDHGSDFTGTFAAHDEPKARCGNYDLMVTDVATIGGMTVASDGAYVVRDGKILPCGVWFHS